MKVEKMFTIHRVGEGHYDRTTKRWVAGDETQDTVCGVAAPGGVSRNRNEEGANRTITRVFYLYTDEWDYANMVEEDGLRYTTQDFKRWPGFMEVAGMVEQP